MDNKLEHIYMFKGLNKEDLSKIAQLAEHEAYFSGQSIFSYGDAADALYLIDRGVVVIKFEEDDHKDIEISKLGTGSHFGELPMLDGEPRSANAVAEGHTDLIRIAYAPLLQLLDSEPQIAIHVYREISRFLGSRLRFTTLDLTYAQAKNISIF